MTLLKLSNSTTLARNMKKKTILVLMYTGAVSCPYALQIAHTYYIVHVVFFADVDDNRTCCARAARNTSRFQPKPQLLSSSRP